MTQELTSTLDNTSLIIDTKGLEERREKQPAKRRKGNAFETVRKLALAAISLYGGTGPEHSFGSSDLNRKLHEFGIAADIGLQGDRSVCAALQRTCLTSKQRKPHLPAAFERDGKWWWVSREYAAEFLGTVADEEYRNA